MEGKKQRRVSSEGEIKGSQSTFSINGGKQYSSGDSDSFYKKLSELLDYSGLSLIFNVREALLDLYLFYLEVTKRGGYHQVSRDRKWDEVVSALKLEGSDVKLPTQLEKLYAHLLYQFEQLYHYRDPAKQTATNSTFTLGPLSNIKQSSERKRKSEASLSQLTDIKDGQMVTKMSMNNSCPMTGAGYTEEQVVLAPSKDKEVKKRRGGPRRHRNAYQIFVKQECARLRSCNQALVGSKLLHMAIDAWRKMSEIERQPYVEQSKKDKERFMKVKNSEKEEQSSQNGKEENSDYHVTLQPGDAEKSCVVNKATVGLALKITEEAPDDPSYLIDCDAYCSLDIPSEAPK